MRTRTENQTPVTPARRILSALLAVALGAAALVVGVAPPASAALNWATMPVGGANSVIFPCVPDAGPPTFSVTFPGGSIGTFHGEVRGSSSVLPIGPGRTLEVSTLGVYKVSFSCNGAPQETATLWVTDKSELDLSLSVSEDGCATRTTSVPAGTTVRVCAEIRHSQPWGHTGSLFMSWDAGQLISTSSSWGSGGEPLFAPGIDHVVAGPTLTIDAPTTLGAFARFIENGDHESYFSPWVSTAITVAAPEQPVEQPVEEPVDHAPEAPAPVEPAPSAEPGDGGNPGRPTPPDVPADPVAPAPAPVPVSTPGPTTPGAIRRAAVAGADASPAVRSGRRPVAVRAVPSYAG